jgi:hypothetical protein
MTNTRLERVMKNQRRLSVFNAAATLTFMGSLCVSILALL